MTNQKRALEENRYRRSWAEIEPPKLPERGKTMNEEAKPETKDQQETPKPELLVLKTGYNQHASPNFPKPTLILNVIAQMKNNGKSDYSIRFVDKALTYISKHANLNEPERVKQFIANLETSNSYKRNLAIGYNKYRKYYQIQWQMPLYQPEAKTIEIPTNEKIEN